MIGALKQTGDRLAEALADVLDDVDPDAEEYIDHHAALGAWQHLRREQEGQTPLPLDELSPRLTLDALLEHLRAAALYQAHHADAHHAMAVHLRSALSTYPDRSQHLERTLAALDTVTTRLGEHA